MWQMKNNTTIENNTMAWRFSSLACWFCPEEPRPRTRKSCVTFSLHFWGKFEQFLMCVAHFFPFIASGTEAIKWIFLVLRQSYSGVPLNYFCDDASWSEKTHLAAFNEQRQTVYHLFYKMHWRSHWQSQPQKPSNTVFKRHLLQLNANISNFLGCIMLQPHLKGRLLS